MKTYKEYNESVRDHMKPRSNKDIRDSIEQMSDEDYESYVADELVPYNKFNMIYNDNKHMKVYRNMIEEGKMKGIIPSDLAKQISDTYHQLNNTGMTSEEIYKEHIRMIGLDESVKDFMKPRPIDDVKKEINKLEPNDRLEKIFNYGIRNMYTEEEIENIIKDTSFLSYKDMYYTGCKLGIVQLVKKALDNGVNINQKLNMLDPVTFDIIYNYFQVACKNGHTDVVKYLIEHGVNVHSNEDKALDFAVAKEYQDIIDLIKNHVNESIRDQMKPKSEGEVWDSIKDLDPTPMLIKSANHGYMKGVVTALDNGADINFDRGSALMGASSSGKLEIVKYLIDKGIGTSRRGKSAFLIPACIEGHIDIVEYLISMGFLKNIPYPRFYELLDMARNRKHKDIVGLLIKHYNADQPSTKHKDYIETIIKNHNESVKDFLKPKSEEDIKKDIKKLKPGDLLLRAAKGGSLSLVKDVINNGVIKDEYALVNASSYGHVDIVEYLIDEIGYDVHYMGELSLRYAVAEGQMDVVKSLLDRGADIHYHNENPLNTAISNSQWDIANYLIKRGADINKLQNVLKTSEYNLSQHEVDNFMKEYMTESVRYHMKPRPMTDISNNVVDNILKDYTDHTIYFTNNNRFGSSKIDLAHHTGDGFMNSIKKRFGKGLYLHVDDDSDNIIRKYLYNLDIDYTPIMSTTYKIKSEDKVRRMIKKLVEEVINENLPMIMIRKFNE